MADRAVAAVSYRTRDRTPEFLLVRTSRGSWWTFPKGHVEDDEAPARAALREAREEAGVIGRLVSQKPFTRYRFVKRRSGNVQDVDAYLVKVTKTVAPKEPKRTPRWCSPAGARALFAEGHNAREHRRVISAALRRLSTGARSAG